MRLSEMRGKEVINLSDGAKMGLILQPEAELDLEQGNVVALVLTGRGGIFNRQESVISWRSVKRISADLILVETADSREAEK